MSVILDPFQTITAFRSGGRFYRRLFFLSSFRSPAGDGDFVFDLAPQIGTPVNISGSGSLVQEYVGGVWSNISPSLFTGNVYTVLAPTPSAFPSLSVKTPTYSVAETLNGIIPVYTQIDYDGDEASPPTHYSNTFDIADLQAIGNIILTGFGDIQPQGFIPATLEEALPFTVGDINNSMELGSVFAFWIVGKLV